MVNAKCGHVGKDLYYKGTFFTKADSGKEAAKKVRNFPRVKHDHKDAILCVKELDYLNYLIGRSLVKDDIYYRCDSKQEQMIYWEDISRNIYADSYMQETSLSKRSHQKHSLKKIYNNDPNYESLKHYRGAI